MAAEKVRLTEAQVKETRTVNGEINWPWRLLVAAVIAAPIIGNADAIIKWLQHLRITWP